MTRVDRSLPKRATGIAIAMLVLLLGAVAPGGALAAKKHHGKANHPAGAVKLPKAKIKHVGKTTCGQIGKKWVAGTLVKGYFLSDTVQAHRYAALAKHARGKAKQQQDKLAKKYAKKAKTGNAICNGHGGGNRTRYGALRFNIASSSIGLALRGSTSGGTTHAVSSARASHVRARAAKGMATASAGTEAGSNMVTISGGGQIADAVSSGKVTIEKFVIGPEGSVYVIFQSPVNLEEAGAGWVPGKGCVFAKVDPASGVPTCVDYSLQRVGVPLLNPINPPVQFDAAGNVYYAGSSTSGGMTVRKWSNGTTTDLIAPAGVYLKEFLVQPDGTVFITGQTQSNNSMWTRRIDPIGALHGLANVSASFMARFPDGKAYFGLFNGSEYFGVDSYDSGTGALASQWWIANSQNPPAPPGGIANDAKPICEFGSPAPTSVKNGFCIGTGSYIAQNVVTPDGRDFVNAAAGPTASAPMRYYPSLAYLSTLVTKASLMVGKGNDLLLAGTASLGDQVLTEYHTSNDTETQLLGPPVTADQYEIFHMAYLAEGDKLLFDGQRFSDNQYVIGEYDFATHEVKVVASSTAKWSDLQGL